MSLPLCSGAPFFLVSVSCSLGYLFEALTGWDMGHPSLSTETMSGFSSQCVLEQQVHIKCLCVLCSYNLTGLLCFNVVPDALEHVPSFLHPGSRTLAESMKHISFCKGTVLWPISPHCVQGPGHAPTSPSQHAHCWNGLLEGEAIRDNVLICILC